MKKNSDETDIEYKKAISKIEKFYKALHKGNCKSFQYFVEFMQYFDECKFFLKGVKVGHAGYFGGLSHCYSQHTGISIEELNHQVRSLYPVIDQNFDDGGIRTEEIEKVFRVMIIKKTFGDISSN